MRAFSTGAARQTLNIFGRDKPPHSTHIGDVQFMRDQRIRLACFRPAFFASSLVACSLIASAPANAQTPYDGLWNVTVVTKTGSCEASTSSTLTVADGKISAPGAEVSGSVGREGLVRVSINGAYANGQLSGNAGSGKWNGASAGVPCSGRWQATRQ